MNPSNAAMLVTPETGGAASIFTRPLRAYQQIARRQTLACGVVLFLTLGIRAALLPWDPPPVPAVEDEFSYLLAADTYASGRLANPPHPMWQHFETEHELMQPVYASKYPPLQGLVLAFGQKFFRQPWIGVYLSAGLMCAAVCWMLQGWIAADWAFLGGILFALHCGVFSYWVNSYWGGAVPAAGGALVLGALVRIWRKRRAVHGITFAAGLAILLLSRPWEGGVLVLEALLVLAWAWSTFSVEYRAKLLCAAIPAILFVAIALGATAYIDRRVTGSALLMPHALYDKQYVIAPMFLFMPLRPEPVYRHPTIRAIYTGWHLSLWRASRSAPMDVFLEKLSEAYNFFFGLWPLLIPPLVWPYALKSPEERITAVLLIGFVLLALFPVSGFQFHYAAPVAGLLYLRLLQTLSRLVNWRPGAWRIGAGVAALCVTLLLYQFGRDASGVIRYGPAVSPFAADRDAIARHLERMGGRQLVLVHYSPDHNLDNEWVWNRADIDASQTVWAQDMGAAANAELIRYYPGRKAWLLEADRTPVKLVPYAEQR